MSPHLTERQISELLIDGDVPELRSHLAACPACAAEVERNQSALHQFRGSVHEWSDAQMSPTFELTARKNSFPVLGRALLLAALLFVTVAVVRWFGPASGTDAPVPAVAAAASDAALLDEVRVDVSRPVPVRLAPLVVSLESAQ